jgi:uncharacterized cupin superfamily protein
MASNWAAKSAAEIEDTYVPFMVDGKQEGVISYLEGGREHIDAGLYRVLPGEHHDGKPTEHTFERDEYLWVVEGRVTVEADGVTTLLTAGDAAFYAAGHHGIWTFEAPFAKFSVEIAVGGEEK